MIKLQFVQSRFFSIFLFLLQNFFSRSKDLLEDSKVRSHGQRQGTEQQKTWRHEYWSTLQLIEPYKADLLLVFSGRKTWKKSRGSAYCESSAPLANKDRNRSCELCITAQTTDTKHRSSMSENKFQANPVPLIRPEREYQQSRSCPG